MRTAAIAIGLVLSLGCFTGCESVSPNTIGKFGGLLGQGELTTDTIAAGLKEALRVGSQRASGELGKPGGYAQNPALRLALPEELDKLASTLRKVGMGSYVDRFEARMNDAAEEAAAQAVPVFADAVSQMTIEDAKTILNGPDDAATQYFKDSTSERLRQMYAPIVKRKMADVGAAQVYNDILAKYNAIPFAEKPDFSLENYVTDQALEGLFAKLAQMEQQIRTDPAARTTQLLKQVFGRQ